MELQHQVLFNLLLFFQQLQSAVAGDAVGQVHHQVAPAQLEKAVNHLAQPATCRTPQVRTPEQLAAA